jgi:subtilase family serine protease
VTGVSSSQTGEGGFMSKRLFGVVALLGICVAVGAPAASARPASVPHTKSVVSAWHVTKKGLTWRFAARAAAGPPTTAQCEANQGVACYSPAQFENAYDMNKLYAAGDAGQGRTIVLVDSFGSPTIKADLATFDKAFGLPAPPSFKIVQPAGPVPTFDPSNAVMANWAFETTLDVEMAHLMAPQANLVLAETPVAETEGTVGFPQIVKAENKLINAGVGDVFSQSFGATEETFPSKSSILKLRSAVKNARAHHVTVLASAGDSGSAEGRLNGTYFRHPAIIWPSSDPLVTSVGGTQLNLDANGNRTAPDNVWNDIPVGIDAAGGGGPSHVFGLPSFQHHVHGTGRGRSTPDISMSAAVNGGAIVYLSFLPGQAGYYIVGGTSEASPLFSGVVAIADQIAGHRLGWINPAMYKLGIGGSSGVVDITSGTNTFLVEGSNGSPLFSVPGWNAGHGYDMASGLGTVDGFKFAHALAKAG